MLRIGVLSFRTAAKGRLCPLPRFAGADIGAAMTSAPRPRLYLVTPQLGDPASFLRDLGPVLEAGDIAALLLRLEPADERALINRAKSVTAVVQRRDVALLLDGHPELAARAGADGAHLFGIEALTAAIGALPAACAPAMTPCSPARPAPIM